MANKYWVKCPICKRKTRIQVYKETTLKNFPLFCPKCKQVHVLDLEQLKIVVKSASR